MKKGSWDLLSYEVRINLVLVTLGLKQTEFTDIIHFLLDGRERHFIQDEVSCLYEVILSQATESNFIPESLGPRGVNSQ